MDIRVLELQLNFESKFYVTMPFDNSDKNDLECLESEKCVSVANDQEDEWVNPQHEMKKPRIEVPPSSPPCLVGLESTKKYTSIPKGRSRFCSRQLKLDRTDLNRTYPISGGSSSIALSLSPNLESTSRMYIYPTTPPPPVPMYNGFQLVGDSQLVRFHNQVLSKGEGFARSLGYCVSGQKIADLETRIRTKPYTICDKIILLIGTNDFTHKTPMAAMCDSYDSILKLLQENGANKIILLTVPPVARMKDRKMHWTMLKRFNEHIMSLKKDEIVYPFDLASVFISYDNSVIMQCYEEKYTDGKTDLVHLNRIGFKFLQFILDINMESNSLS
ncbi:hypothetical protein PPYR_07375 [Photinus pyralis]|uniref:OSK domain-containing protein n=1 Tax=Photinus pyralis TaxID=7054 RepID=A0A5N4AQ60_PHOPY|nr:hypothetical protein PPYR_07375 [Photinus pyralis]